MACVPDSDDRVEELRALGRLEWHRLSPLTDLEIAALRAVGLRCLGNDRPEEAADVFEYLCFLRPDGAGDWEALALARLACGRIGAACTAAECAASLGPTTRRAGLAARCRMIEGDDEAAAVWMLRARELGAR
jgi:hypothetical protein